MDWAAANKLIINLLKTKEIVFWKPHCRSLHLPDPVPGIERVKVVKLLGVFLSSRFSMDEQVNFIITIINQRYYLLSQLKKQGLPLAALKTIFHAMVVSRIEYALPCFAGFLSEVNRNRLNATLKKAVRWGLTDTNVTIQEVTDRADSRLFTKIQDPHHCLNSLLPPASPASSHYDLRSRGHALTLPLFKSSLFKQSFIMRTLYKFK